MPEYRKGKSPDSWDWLDWGVKNTIDQQPIQMAFYYLALKEAKKMAEVLGKEDHIEWYNKRMNTMKPAYDKAFWKNGYYSTDIEKFKDDRANAIAIVSGIANPEYYDQIVDNVLTQNYFSSPHFEWMVEEAMCIAGRQEESLIRMKEQYQSQVDNESLSTLYEMFPKGGSYNHAWNAPNTILSKYIAGVEPTKVGWSEYQIMPTLLHLKSLKKTIPTVKGTIDLSIEANSNTYQLLLDSPEKTTAIVGIPKTDKEILAVKVDNKIVWKNGKLNKEHKGFSYFGEDAEHMKFKAKAGKWKIEATYK